jgi:hypothetical protein
VICPRLWSILISLVKEVIRRGLTRFLPIAWVSGPTHRLVVGPEIAISRSDGVKRLVGYRPMLGFGVGDC